MTWGQVAEQGIVKAIDLHVGQTGATPWTEPLTTDHNAVSDKV